MSLINNEIGKQKRFVPVRDLTRRAGRALQALKPCWMMSPLSVAQYLPKGQLKFDLVIIDEASQMPPEEALGSILRGSRVLVVGDTNQLPPSNFFKQNLDNDDEPEDEAVLDESILELANGAFYPPRRLKWHYRSRHSALIKFSNAMVYKNDLVVFPSPSENRPDSGVSLVQVHGRYKSGTNAEEAAAMHDDPEDAELDLPSNDGFGNDEDDDEADYVVWQGETAAHSACVHFLHGALHLFDSGAELKKYTWVRKGEPLLDQARAAIAEGSFPLFVAEGTSAQKKERIRHNAYLYQGLKQLTANAVQAKQCFFIFGHSLATNDDHILTRLGRGRFANLYVGIYGDAESPVNREIMARANGLGALRHAAFPLEVNFYSAESAHVWG